MEYFIFVAGMFVGGAIVWIYAARIKKAKDIAEEALAKFKK